jgi:hypothetical protein
MDCHVGKYPFLERHLSSDSMDPLVDFQKDTVGEQRLHLSSKPHKTVPTLYPEKIFLLIFKLYRHE